ncbi:DUF4123 domain-containing protein [Cupriavidus sp. 2SB]|uniref:DUF4123 domain-containing protein n=1 Tax=Cupriavidus sp. 2SB TaxID=2502199 RepID=UPI0010F9182F|nr:DUF4123 domain-containing protein [Cupriavidus sp. 2SB]
MHQWKSLDATDQQRLLPLIDDVTAIVDGSARGLFIYLLLDQAQDNPLADALTESASIHRMYPVPDPYFARNSALAPQLVALASPPGVTILREIVAAAYTEAKHRLRPHYICGLLWSEEEIHAVADHLLRLGYQSDPADEPRLFRYQDPRVMQRLWPALTAAQQAAWLGPIRQWWSYPQPHGPMPCDGATGERVAAVAENYWVRAVRPTELAANRVSLSRRFLSAQQWALAHLSPAISRFWLHLAQIGPTAYRVPDEADVVRWLMEADGHQLKDADAVDYAISIFRSSEEVWRRHDMQAAVIAALSHMNAEPGIGFGDAFGSVAPTEYRFSGV